VGNERSPAILISASCTTSWFDWIHGELWLCPDGILRRSLGLWSTLRHGRGPTLDVDNRPTGAFSAADVQRIAASGRRNRWVPWTSISSATLKTGVVDHSLHLELGPTRRAKFLWLKVDGGFEILEPALEHALPGRVTIVRQPMG
jgi:hypothetical protein